MTFDSQVVAAGHICLDIIPTFLEAVELPPPGELWQVGPAVVSTGGSVSNTGLALYLLGIETRLMGKIGNDPLGQTLLNLVRARDPAPAEGLIVANGEATAYTIVVNPPLRDRSFLHCSGANDTLCAADFKLDTISRTRLFHFGYPALLAQMYANNGAEMVEMFRTVKSLGVTTSLDTVMYDQRSAAARADWRGILQRTMPFVDMMLPSIEELLLMLEPEHYFRLRARGEIVDEVGPALLHDLSDLILSWGAAIVVIKLSHNGMYLRTGSRERLARMGAARPADVAAWENLELWAPVFKIERFGGTTGAGDSAIAGFLAALINGRSPQAALTFACAVGACCVEEPDAFSGIQSWDATWARIDGGWPRVPLQIGAPNWRFDAAAQLWTRASDH